MLFVRKHAIRYLLVYPATEVEPGFLSHWQLIAEDKASGERFFQLKEASPEAVPSHPD